MAEIRCPMCGRPNPDDRDVCEFCGARLKPLTGALEAANEEPIHPGEEPTARSTSELEKTLPDWLRSLRQDGESAPEAPSQGTAAGEEEADDFFKHLADLSADPEASSGEPLEEGQEADLSGGDFLSRLAGLQPSEPAPGPETTTPSTSPTDDLLAGLSAMTAASASEPASPAEAAGGSPDWLAGLSSAQDSEEAETPDWLKAMSARFARQESAPSVPAGEESDWRSQLDEQEKAAAAPAPEAELEAGPPALDSDEQPGEPEETPAWLRDLQAQADAAAASSEASEPQTGAEGTPAWLAGLRGGSDFPSGAATIAAGTPETPGEAEPEEDIPDWLKPAAAAAAGATMISAHKQDEPAPAEEVPDWLKGMQAGTAGMAAASEEEEEIPDWLKPAGDAEATSVSMNAQGALPGEETPDWLEGLEPASEETPPPAEQGELPDWLKGAAAAGLVAAATGEPAPQASTEPPTLVGGTLGAGAEQGAEAQPPSEEKETPAWLKGLAAGAAAGAAASAVKGPSEPVPEASAEPPTMVGGTLSAGAEPPAEGQPPTEEKETPAWLKGLAAGTAAGAAASAVGGQSEAAGQELFPAALPSWLDEVKPPEGGTPAPGEGPITQGELPSWVQALRPVEAVEVAGEVEEGAVEDKGPLAGFSNVLPAAAGAAIHQVSPYPNKLLVNESQQAQLELLERQVAGERTARPPVARARISSSRMLRWGIAALLLAFVALPIIFHSQVTPGVSLYPPELVSTIKVIDDLPPTATVLVVVDYQPASSGELEALSTPLLDQLRLRGATSVFVSSTAAGSALADRLVARVDSDLQGAAAQQYINLGYLTGGPSGIANFAAAPAQAAPHTVSGVPAWGLPPLQGVSSLSDFAAMVVLTDSSDTGAMWIEQGRARLGASPMLLGISAQAEPMLQPYYDSQQVQGMVTGLPGGIAYEQANGISSISSHYWDAFSVGFLVADFIVAVGGVLALLAAWQSRRSRPGGEAS
jgi:hypothetical protein